MAYKQTPGRGNRAKTGHGIPAPFKQMETIKKIGSAISHANEAGKESYDKSISRDNLVGGRATYTKNPISYVTGFASDIMSDSNPKTKEKKKSPVKQMETIKKIGNKIYEGGKWLADAAEGRHGSENYSGGDEDMRQKNIARNNAKTNEVKKPVAKTIKKASPVKQMETIKKVVSKVKEVGSKVGSAISHANEAGKKSYDKSISRDNLVGGRATYTKNPVSYVTGFAKDIVSDDNSKTNEKKKSPAKQLGKQAVTKISGKKAVAKMKKC